MKYNFTILVASILSSCVGGNNVSASECDYFDIFGEEVNNTHISFQNSENDAKKYLDRHGYGLIVFQNKSGIYVIPGAYNIQKKLGSIVPDIDESLDIFSSLPESYNKDIKMIILEKSLISIDKEKLSQYLLRGSDYHMCYNKSIYEYSAQFNIYLTKLILKNNDN